MNVIILSAALIGLQFPIPSEPVNQPWKSIPFEAVMTEKTEALSYRSEVKKLSR